MYAHELAAYTRRILDENNKVFLPDSLLATFLERGEVEYREHIPQEAWSRTYQPAALANVASLNLDTILFGVQPAAPPPPPRCQRILRVIMVDATTGAFRSAFEPASSFESLAPTSSAILTVGGSWPGRYWLDGRLLRFSAPVSGTIQIVYLPDSSVNWQTGVLPPVPPALGAYIDDFAKYHDVIGLLAAQQYAMGNSARNPKIDERLELRLRAMDEFFSQTRSGQGSRYVREDW